MIINLLDLDTAGSPRRFGQDLRFATTRPFDNRPSDFTDFRLSLPVANQTEITEEMNITLNNEPLTIDAESITVEKLLELKRYTFRLRIVKINGRLIGRDSYGREVIYDGDTVQVIYLMSGG